MAEVVEPGGSWGTRNETHDLIGWGIGEDGDVGL
jgi:hypothetical protein